MRNDPLLNNAILLDGYTAVALGPRLKFCIDTSQYFTIVRDLYLYLTRDKQFKAAISRAMFEYYAVVLLWDRIMFVLSEEEQDRTRSVDIRAALPADLAIPEELGRYLDGIGNFTDSAGRQAILALLDDLSGRKIHGIAGHYDRVTAESHVYYETLPAPFVVAYRMCYEYVRYAMDRVPPPPKMMRNMQTTHHPTTKMSVFPTYGIYLQR